MSVQARFGGTQPTICPGCHRLATGFGYSPNKNAKSWIWFCDACVKIGKYKMEKLYKMPTAKLEIWERRSTIEAGEVAGQYLEELGLGELFERVTPQEWEEFLRRLIVAREKKLRNAILTNEAPF